MIAPGPGVRVYLATQPCDMRNYAERRIMWSPGGLTDSRVAVCEPALRIILGPHLPLSMANSLSGGWNRPALRLGAEVAFSASNFSVGSARRYASVLWRLA